MNLGRTSVIVVVEAVAVMATLLLRLMLGLLVLRSLMRRTGTLGLIAALVSAMGLGELSGERGESAGGWFSLGAPVVAIDSAKFCSVSRVSVSACLASANAADWRMCAEDEVFDVLVFEFGVLEDDTVGKSLMAEVSSLDLSLDKRSSLLFLASVLLFLDLVSSRSPLSVASLVALPGGADWAMAAISVVTAPTTPGTEGASPFLDLFASVFSKKGNPVACSALSPP